MAPTFLPSRYSGRISGITASRRDTNRAAGPRSRVPPVAPPPCPVLLHSAHAWRPATIPPPRGLRRPFGAIFRLAVKSSAGALKAVFFSEVDGLIDHPADNASGVYRKLTGIRDTV